MAGQRDGYYSRWFQNEPTALSRGERVARCGVFTSRSGSGEGAIPRHDPSILANASGALAWWWRAIPPPLYSHHQRPQENSKSRSAKSISKNGTDVTVEGCEKRRFRVVECEDDRGQGGEAEHWEENRQAKPRTAAPGGSSAAEPLAERFAAPAFDPASQTIELQAGNKSENHTH